MHRARAAAVALAAVGVVLAAVLAWLLWIREEPQIHVVASPRAASEELDELPAPAILAVREEVTTERGADSEEAPHRQFAIVPADERSARKGPFRADPERRFGQVVRARDLSPLRGATIGLSRRFPSLRMHHGDAYALDEVTPLTTTDADGVFELAPDGPNVVIAIAEGFGPLLVDRDWLGKTRETAHFIPFESVAGLHARVVDRAGAPMQSVEVRLLASCIELWPPAIRLSGSILPTFAGSRRATDALGEADFRSLTPLATFDVELWSGEKLLLREPQPLVFKPGQELRMEWRLGGGCVVTGRVIDQDEEPVASQELWLTQRGFSLGGPTTRAWFSVGDEEEVSQHVMTDAAGEFEISNVTAGHWWLGIPVLDRDSFEEIPPDAIAPVAQAFEVRERHAKAELTLRVTRGVFIRGKVVDPDGKPASASIRAQTIPAVVDGSLDASTKHDGAFVLGPLEPGEYEVTADPRMAAIDARFVTSSLSQPAVAGGEDVQLALRRGVPSANGQCVPTLASRCRPSSGSAASTSLTHGGARTRTDTTVDSSQGPMTSPPRRATAWPAW